MAQTDLGQAAINASNTASTAANIAKGITDKSTGKSPEAKLPVKDAAKTPENVPVVDPNAGKEKYVVDGKEVYLSPEQAKAYVQKGLAFEPKMDHLGRLQQ